MSAGHHMMIHHPYRHLPQMYTPVEWLQSTNGEQFIRTDIATKDIGENGRIVTTVRIFSLKNRFIGYIHPTTIYSNLVLATADSDPTFLPYCYGGDWENTQWTGFNCLQETPFDINWRFRYKPNNEQELRLENGKYSVLRSRDWWRNTTSTYYITLFKVDDDHLGTTRIYSCKFYSYNTLVGDFIPVRYKNEGMMYDFVRNKAYSNQGTGSFLYGKDL